MMLEAREKILVRLVTKFFISSLLEDEGSSYWRSVTEPHFDLRNGQPYELSCAKGVKRDL